MEQLLDITEVCALLGTTSRTLRYYEAEGLIESTTAYPSKRRRYTEAQLTAIKQVLALRTQGILPAGLSASIRLPRKRIVPCTGVRSSFCTIGKKTVCFH